MMKKLSLIITILISALVLFFSIRGVIGNPTAKELVQSQWRVNGPFELSPESGRFALTYSIVEDKSVFFSPDIARFTSPDVGYKDGHYVSLFAPALSYIVMPGYILGKYLGASQVGIFSVISLFAILNVILIRSIALKLKANEMAASIAGLLFLFATPAYAYAVNLYQHHVSTFLILTGIYALLTFKDTIAMLIVFLIFGSAIPLDYPNVFFLLPLGLYAGFKSFSLENIRNQIIFKINFLKLFTPFIVIIPLLFFFWFNSQSYGGPLKMLGNSGVVSVDVIDAKGKPVCDTKTKEKIKASDLKNSSVAEKTSGLLYFQTRNLLNGFYIHIISPDRGMLYYAPIMFFGFAGFILAWRKKVKLSELLFSIILLNILLYSMWGDPWGGWAFGSRYLIPSYAVLSIFIALLLTYWGKNIWFIIVFSAVALYSMAVNTLGAITTSALPPKVQVLQLEAISGVVQKYTYARNWDFLNAGHSKSFMYQSYLHNYMSAVNFYYILVAIIALLYICLAIGMTISLRKSK
jgi:hypothetical protein